jgi:hypothetical protein
MSYEARILSAEALSLGDAEVGTRVLSLADTRRELSRLGTGLGLTAAYGLALGARGGGVDLLRHAFGAPLGLLVVALITAPALFVRLALLDAPLRPAQMLGAVAQGCFNAGLTLAGLAPAAAMLVVSIESKAAAAWMSGLGLALGGGIGLFTLCAALRPSLAVASSGLRGRAFLSVALFVTLSCLLSARVWGAWLPLCGGQP